MDLKRIIKMFVGMFALKALRGVLSRGAGVAGRGPAARTGGGAKPQGTGKAGAGKTGAGKPATPEATQARIARETAKRARKAAQLTRRIGR